MTGTERTRRYHAHEDCSGAEEWREPSRDWYETEAAVAERECVALGGDPPWACIPPLPKPQVSSAVKSEETQFPHGACVCGLPGALTVRRLKLAKGARAPPPLC